MKRNDLYSANGWICAEQLFSDVPFTVAIGGRGIGKTYGCLRYLYENKIPFIYMRRTQAQLDSVVIPALNPYNKPAADMGVHITSDRLGKYSIGFYNAELKEDKLIRKGEPFAIGIALSTFAAIRGLSAEQYKVLLFDEIIPERHERPIKEAGLAFANVIESINRNRELDGLEPLKVILLSNSNTLGSDILMQMNLLSVIDKMIRRGDNYYNNSLVEIFRYLDSPISDKKRDTALYKLMGSGDFSRMSLDNEFARDDFEYVAARPLPEYNPVVAINGMTVFKHKSKPEYYVIDGEKTDNVYQITDNEKRAFMLKYNAVFRALERRKVIFQSAPVKIKWKELF